MKKTAVSCVLLLAVAAFARNEESVASLPPMSEEIIDRIDEVLEPIKYPIRFRELYEKLGGDKALVWRCYVHEIGVRTVGVFAVTNPDAPEGRYVVEFEFRPPLKGPPFDEMCVGARLAYTSQFGQTFYREAPAKRPNQPPEPTALSVTPRACARVAPASTVAHL